MPPSSAAAPSVVDRKLPDLGNTAIAFASKSDADLWKAKWLFTVIGTPWLTKLGSGFTKAALALHLPVKGLVKATIFKQFCGGETIKESLKSAMTLANSGIGTILDHSVEGQDDEDELDGTVKETLLNIAVSKERKDVPFCVFKPTGISRTELLEIKSSGRTLSEAEKAEWDRVEQRVEKICSAAHAADAPIFVDAEESWVQPAVDELVERMMERFNTKRAIVFNTAQLYRTDRLAYVKAAHARATAKGYHFGVKLVRGAYMEKERDAAEKAGRPSPIHVNKAAVDADYDDALRYCADHLANMAVCVGTHNEKSTLLIASLLDAKGLARNDERVWFAQLLGMSDNISYNVSAAGYNVAKYMPYGPVREVLPYLIRRAEENTSARGQTGRELGLIKAERERRKARQ